MASLTFFSVQIFDNGLFKFTSSLASATPILIVNKRPLLANASCFYLQTLPSIVSALARRLTAKEITLKFVATRQRQRCSFNLHLQTLVVRTTFRMVDIRGKMTLH